MSVSEPRGEAVVCRRRPCTTPWLLCPGNQWVGSPKEPRREISWPGPHPWRCSRRTLVEPCRSAAHPPKCCRKTVADMLRESFAWLRSGLLLLRLSGNLAFLHLLVILSSANDCYIFVDLLVRCLATLRFLLDILTGIGPIAHHGAGFIAQPSVLFHPALPLLAGVADKCPVGIALLLAGIVCGNLLPGSGVVCLAHFCTHESNLLSILDCIG